MTWVLVLACGLACVPAGLRWLRVGQREHYLAPSVTTFAVRWWTNGWLNWALLVVAVAGLVGSFASPSWGFLVALAQVGPIGLSVRGVGPPLAWTARLRRLAALTGLVLAALLALGGLTANPPLVVIGVFGLPVIIDAGLALLGPVELALGSRWVRKAARKLEAVGAEVVAITGSYGKTTTKNYVAHLLGGSRRTVASPASFNNRMGLARSINENLTPGTEVFVAEMGTYGPGEIEDLCQWMPPKVAAIVAIGPVHLERFRSEERIVAAKSEILDRADVGVLNIDHPLLRNLAEERSREMVILEVSTGDRGRVIAEAGKLVVDGRAVADLPEDVFAANLAVAIGICLALGSEVMDLLPKLDDLPKPDHRQSVSESEAGFTIIDDTFNSNPAGAARALEILEGLPARKRVVVTPGMVELGPIQDRENRLFAEAASKVADHLVVVANTNRKALVDGADGGRASVTVVPSREEAVTWVRANLGPGDAVLYENDLPDHYP